MKSTLFKLKALTRRKRPIKEIKAVDVDSFSLREIDKYVFVKIGDLDSKQFGGLTEDLINFMDKTKKTVMIIPDNVDFFRLEQVKDEPNN